MIKLCFYLSCILRLETRLHEFQNKWSPNSNGFFFIVDLALVPGVWFEVIVAAKRFSFHQPLFPPLSLLNSHFFDCGAAEPVETLHLGLFWGCFLFGVFWGDGGSIGVVGNGVGSFWYYSSPTWFDQGSNITTETWRRGHTGHILGRLNWTG